MIRRILTKKFVLNAELELVKDKRKAAENNAALAKTFGKKLINFEEEKKKKDHNKK